MTEIAELSRASRLLTIHDLWRRGSVTVTKLIVIIGQKCHEYIEDGIQAGLKRAQLIDDCCVAEVATERDVSLAIKAYHLVRAYGAELESLPVRKINCLVPLIAGFASDEPYEFSIPERPARELVKQVVSGELWQREKIQQSVHKVLINNGKRPRKTAPSTSPWKQDAIESDENHASFEYEDAAQTMRSSAEEFIACLNDIVVYRDTPLFLGLQKLQLAISKKLLAAVREPPLDVPR